jgi:hypothetical protein
MVVFSGVRSLTFMSFLKDWLKALRHSIRTAFRVFVDFLSLLALACRSRRAVEAENLFLRKQQALFQERKTKPRRADDSTRWLVSFVSRRSGGGSPARQDGLGCRRTFKR